MTALTNPKKALDKICDIGKELNISVTKEEVIKYFGSYGQNYRFTEIASKLIFLIRFFIVSNPLRSSF